MDGFSLSVAGYVVKPEPQNFKQAIKCWNAKKMQQFQRKSQFFVPPLCRHEPPRSSLPTAMTIFFTYFPLVYVYFRSISFAFRHSLKTAFPCIPLLSVAGYVVRNPCGAWSSSPEAILFQAKKVVKFESGCLKPTVNSGEVSSDELHLRLQ